MSSIQMEVCARKISLWPWSCAHLTVDGKEQCKIAFKANLVYHQSCKSSVLPLITRHIHMRRPQQTPPRYRVSQRFIKHIALPSMSRQPPRPMGKSDQCGRVEHQGWNGTGNPFFLGGLVEALKKTNVPI